jgi:hypothetical protein
MSDLGHERYQWNGPPHPIGKNVPGADLPYFQAFYSSWSNRRPSFAFLRRDVQVASVDGRPLVP